MKSPSIILDLLCRSILFLTVCGLIGWCYETILTSILRGHFCGFFARGLLHVPVCPIYGFFAMLLLRIFRLPFLKRQTGWKRCFWAFILGSSISTILELGCSYLLEWILGDFLWSYSGWLLNFQERISLPSSLLFGILTLLLIVAIAPAFQKLIQRLSRRMICILGCSCALVLGADLAVTLL